ncbi:glyoxalase superfamily protein [Neorhizobium sp. P12A]|uniref:glyoxalase superfamily protein n=1 Tax=Neorhizobium sp. P12A TaxID=2268027 RepID=UPI0011EF5E17|nr:glyoxalase superfamily protein [Neorhizobium sp. P12A]
MNTYREAKHMAKVLEEILRARNVSVSHGETLNIVARQFGLNDWNTLSARIKREEVSGARRMQALASWDFVAEHPREFDFGLDEDARNSRRGAALIRYSGAKPTRYREFRRAFGTLAQTVSAVPFHGQRIEIRADLATEKVSQSRALARVSPLEQTRL